jgi:hypothetical protein
MTILHYSKIKTSNHDFVQDRNALIKHVHDFNKQDSLYEKIMISLPYEHNLLLIVWCADDYTLANFIEGVKIDNVYDTGIGQVDLNTYTSKFTSYTRFKILSRSASGKTNNGNARRLTRMRFADENLPFVHIVSSTKNSTRYYYQVEEHDVNDCVSYNPNIYGFGTATNKILLPYV